MTILIKETNFVTRERKNRSAPSAFLFSNLKRQIVFPPSVAPRVAVPTIIWLSDRIEPENLADTIYVAVLHCRQEVLSVLSHRPKGQGNGFENSSSLTSDYSSLNNNNARVNRFFFSFLFPEGSAFSPVKLVSWKPTWLIKPKQLQLLLLTHVSSTKKKSFGGLGNSCGLSPQLKEGRSEFQRGIG